MKKLLTLLLALTLCIVAVPCNVDAKAKSKEIKVTSFKKYSVDNITYKMPKGWKESSDDDGTYYEYNEKNIAMVQTYDCEYGFDNKELVQGFIEGLTSDKGVTLLSQKTKKFKDGITSLTTEIKFKEGSDTYYMKTFSFVYNEKLYSFSVLSDLKKNTKILDKLITKIELKE